MIPGIVAQAASGADGGEQPLEGTVELLLGFNGTNGATTFYDEGRRARPLSYVGSVVHSNAQSKFGGTSGRCDGANDAIFVPAGPGLIFGAEPFAVEGFARFASLSPAIQFVATHRSGDGTNNCAWSIAKNAQNKFELFVGADARPDVVSILSINPVVINRWYHVAVTRDGEGTLRFFVDGVLQGKVANVIQITELRKPIIIGASGYNSSTGVTGNGINGWLDEIRIVKGDAVYDSDAAFTPPISQFPRPVQETTPPVDPYFANVIALFGFDGNEGSFVFRDDSTNQRTQLYKWGYGVNTKVQGAIGGRRGAAYDIPVSSGMSIIELADTANLAFGTQPFTVEAWVRQDAWRSNQLVIGQRVSGGTQNGQAWNMTVLDNGRLEWQMIDNSGTAFSVATPVPTLLIGRTPNAWCHLAVSRDADGVVRLYVNGVLELQQSPATLPFSVRDVSTNLTLFGAAERTSGLALVGSADEVRVTRGIARYVTAKFDIPETQFSRGENDKPNFAVDPTIVSLSGFFAVGDTLRLNYGTHNGRDPLPQWRRDGEPIPGATGRSYTLAAADAGAQIDAGVAVWNYQGDTTAYAAPVGPVAASPAYETGALAPAGDMQSGGDRLIPNGDAQSGGDVLLWKERIQ